ncbi:MAG: hypothetical protein WA252_09170 [Candidatus Sulfotelmatobacter sp.]|jgi:hypothetical protein
MKLRSVVKLFAPIFAVLALFASSAFADALRGTLVNEEPIRVSPGSDGAKLMDIGRGRELVIIESSHDWVHVQAILTKDNQDEGIVDDDEDEAAKTVTGWVAAAGVVTTTTQDGDRIIFGEAADSENEASHRNGRRDAAQDAMRLYYRLYDLMPTSPLAGEALYRAADDRWQMERADVMSRPSARERETYMRGQMREDWMKLVIKKYPGTKWAALADFRLIENKLCGDWQGLSKCPDKEAELYENYAREHSQSPAAPEALYDAAWRRAALIDIYRTEPNQKKSAESKDQALKLSQRLITLYPQQGDWALRAQRLIFYIQQGIPTYGSTD